MKALQTITLIIGLILLSGDALALTTGPVQNPLRVLQLYTKDAANTVYVQFQSGAMPACYNDAGGRLRKDNPQFDEIYSQLLMILAIGGIRAEVLYTVDTPGGGWATCTINGLWIVQQG